MDTFRLNTLNELAQACSTIASELRRPAQRTPDERRALAMRTAELLSEIAHRLKGSEHAPGSPEFASSRTVGGFRVAFAEQYANSAGSLRTLLLSRAATHVLGGTSGRDWCGDVHAESRQWRYRMAYDSEAGFLECLAELEECEKAKGQTEG